VRFAYKIVEGEDGVMVMKKAKVSKPKKSK